MSRPAFDDAERAGRNAEPEAVGRETELEAVAAFVSDHAAGACALALVGEAGIGKTTVWDAAVAAARRGGALSVLAARAFGEEAQLGFGGLADLLSAVEPRFIESLPGPQRRALEVALLLRDVDEATDPRALPAAVLRVLHAVASARPLLVAIDDIARLDAASADALAFAARRLASAPVRFLFTRRAPAEHATALERALRAETLLVPPLSYGAVARIWRLRLGITLARPLGHRLYEAAGGNPLFALELARTVHARGGALGPGEPVPLPAGVEAALSDRLATITPPMREALLAVQLAGAVRPGDLASAVPAGALEAAVEADLLRRDGERVRLSHPLLGAAAAARSSAGERRAMHGRLALAGADEERRAYHVAMATAEPDAAAARTVSSAAARAMQRGAIADAAELGEHALRLTAPASPERFARLLAAAEYQNAAGNLGRVTELLAPALEAMPAGAERVRALILLADGSTRTMDECLGYLDRALAESEGYPLLRSRVLAQLTLVNATGRVSQIARSLEQAEEALRLAIDGGDPADQRYPLTYVLWLRSLRGLPDRGELSRSQASAHTLPLAHSLERPRGVNLMWRGELSAARSIFTRMLELADDRGAVEAHFVFRLQLIELELRAGNWGTVEAMLEEWAHQSYDAIGGEPAFLRCSALLAVGRGDASEARRLAGEAIAKATPIDSQWQRLEALRADGIAALLDGDAAAAVASLRALWVHLRSEGVENPGAFPASGDLVEALCANGQLTEAREVATVLEEQARAQSHPWGLVTLARCRGLIALSERADPQAATELAEAAAGYERLGMPFDQARTLVPLGTALRRARRRADARATLELAHELFARIGCGSWGSLAVAEMAHIGGRRSDAGLTPTQQRVAQLVAQGRANKEIAAELVVTVSTVERHLTRIYETLGIASRTELVRWSLER